MRFLLIPITLTLLGGLPGCASSSRTKADLRCFVFTDPFTVGDGSVFPEPARLDPHLLRYVRETYHIDPDVRGLLAGYFLRYDKVLLQGGLLDVGGKPGDLIHLLWVQEGERNTVFLESGSNTAMRAWIEACPNWFPLSIEDARLLEFNKALFARLQETWHFEN